MSNEKLVRKVLRTLPKRFAHKVTTIEEAQDLTTMRFDELIRNLTTFKMMFESSESNEKKGIALQANCKDTKEEDLVETMSLLAKNFNKTLKCFNKNSYYGENSPGVECPNYINKQSKSYYTTLSDDESDEEEGSYNKVNNFVAFTARNCKEDTKNQELMKQVENQRVEICSLEEKIQGMIKGNKMMNSSTTVLDEILLQGKRSGDNTVIGFAGESSRKRMTSPTRK
ncbi:hypothetical protein LIER_15954 [Lithospermum erythrorhizon]|uniref:Gag-pol polyprotein n=1 Tax=Lithospermum erythrorhizon TaxID=34254 RepID=A0AAV3QA30_LITER